MNICMRWIFSYRDIIFRTFGFALDRIIPVMLYFLPIMILANIGNKEDMACYSIVSSLFTSFVSFPLGFTSSIRYYAAKISREANKQILYSGICLTFILSIISASLNYLYFIVFINRTEYGIYVLIFLISIFFVSIYYAITSFNEGNNNIKQNNVCGIFALPIYIIIFLILKYISHNLVFSCVIAFLVTRLFMLCFIIIKTLSLEKDIMFLLFDSYIMKIFKYGLPISLLFFMQKIVNIFCMTILQGSPLNVSIYQIIITFSMIFSLFSNALGSVAFIDIIKYNNLSSLRITVINLFVTYLMCYFILWFYWGTLLNLIIKDKDIVAELLNNFYLIMGFILVEILMTYFVIVARSIEEVWRPQALWITCMFLGVVYLFGRSASYKSFLYVSICADILVCLSIIFFIYKKFTRLR